MNTKLHRFYCLFATLALLAALNSPLATAFAQGTVFTYQGRLNNGTNPVTGLYDLKFHLYDSSGGGSILGGPVTNTAVPVTNGMFPVMADFSAGAPREEVTPAQYASFAEAANAAGLTGTIPVGGLSGVALLAGGNNFTGDQTGNGTVQVDRKRTRLN